jgi:hypothetical protein
MAEAFAHETKTGSRFARSVISSSHYDRWGGGMFQIVIAAICHCEER